MNRRYGGIFLCLCGVSLLLCGCRKELCYDHDMHGLNVRVVVQPEWECVWERDHGMNWDDNWAEDSAADMKTSVPIRLRESRLSSMTGTDRVPSATCRPKEASCR